MQTPKARTGSSEVPQRKSPATPRTAQQLKTPGSDHDSVSSPSPASRTPKNKSPKVNERRSPRSPATEKRPSRVSELELQLAQLQEDLKKANEQLNTSESLKRRAHQEAESTKKQLATMAAKLEESEQQLMELSASEDARVDELRKISYNRDKAWQSELEAVQKQHSMDSAALASAMNEIQKLKGQLEIVMESEIAQTKRAETAHADLQGLRMELTVTLSLVEQLKNELLTCRESEAQALVLARNSQKQLETENATAEMHRLDGIKAMEACNALSLELEQSKAQVKSLDELVSKLKADLANRAGGKLENPTGDAETPQKNVEDEERNLLKSEVNSLKLEVGQLRSALEASETRYQEEYIQSTLQIRSAYEQVEQVKLQSANRVTELEAELKEAKSNIEQLRANLNYKDMNLRSTLEDNKRLNLTVEKNQLSEGEPELAKELKKLENDLTELKASLLDKETKLQNVTEENEILKMEMEEAKERSKVEDEAASVAEAANAAEQEAPTKLGDLKAEVDRCNRRAARLTEQLDAAQAANTELETELRRSKVQSDQWRKAAEAATAMLSTGNNGRTVERTGSVDNYTTIASALGSPYSEDMDEDSPKKKNGNMLKKIGVLWKKGQK